MKKFPAHKLRGRDINNVRLIFNWHITIIIGIFAVFEELRNSLDITADLRVQQQGEVVMVILFANKSNPLGSNQELDYSISTQKALFEKCLGLRFKLTEGIPGQCLHNG